MPFTGEADTLMCDLGEPHLGARRPKHMRRLTNLVVIAVLLSACGSGGDIADRDTTTTIGSRPAGQGTLEGLVLAGPTCPVQRDPPDPACSDRPVPLAILVVLDLAGDEVGRGVSDQEGRFSISLPSGSYRLVPQPVEGLLGTAGSQDVQVKVGDTEAVTVSYDTGIR